MLYNDSEFLQSIASLETRLKALETSKQPYYGDWIPLDTSNFAYYNASYVTVSNYSMSIFPIGCRVKYIQGGVTKYSYVFDKFGSRLWLSKGTINYTAPDWTVENLPITYFAIGPITPAPSGMGGFLYWTPTFSTTPTYQDFKYSLTGSLLTLTMSLYYDTNALSGLSTLTISLPADVTINYSASLPSAILTIPLSVPNAYGYGSLASDEIVNFEFDPTVPSSFKLQRSIKATSLTLLQLFNSSVSFLINNN